MEKDGKTDRNNTLMDYFPENNETAANLLRSAVVDSEIMSDLVIIDYFEVLKPIDTVTNIKKIDVLNETINSLNKFMDNFKLEEIKSSNYGTEHIGRG